MNKFLSTPLFTLILLLPISPLRADPVQVTYKKGLEGRPSEMRSKGVVRGTPEEVWEAIIRINEWGKYMPTMPISFYLSDVGVGEIRRAPTRNPNLLAKLARSYRIDVPIRRGGKWDGVAFQLLNLPFPVVNRWFLLHYVNDETKSPEHRYQQCWEMIDGNVNSAHGCFRLSPGGTPEETLLEYEEISDIGGHVPEWVVKMGAHQTTPDVFRNLEKEAARFRISKGLPD